MAGHPDVPIAADIDQVPCRRGQGIEIGDVGSARGDDDVVPSCGAERQAGNRLRRRLRPAREVIQELTEGRLALTV